MFPTQEVTTDNLTNSSNEVSTIGKSFLFDFETGDFVLKDGKLVEITGYEALKMWVNKILRTDKNKFKIYDGVDYGITSLKGLITSEYPFAFIKSEIEREIKETLLKNTAITSVENFIFERNKTLLTVTFNCSTIYGNVENEVII